MLTPKNLAANSVTAKMTDARENAVLANLFQCGQQRWQPHLEAFEMRVGQVLYDSGKESEYLYFPVTAQVSLLLVTASGSAAEVAAVGNQGMVGIGLLLGDALTPGSAVVCCAGTGFRLKAQFIREEVNQPSPLMEMMLHCSRSLIAQMANNIDKLSAISY